MLAQVRWCLFQEGSKKAGRAEARIGPWSECSGVTERSAGGPHAGGLKPAAGSPKPAEAGSRPG